MIDALTARVAARASGLGFSVYAEGESSDFVRFTKGAIRQPGSVVQAFATVRLFDGARHASVEIGLSGDPAVDGPRCDAAVDQLRAALPHVPPDPHLLRPDTRADTDQAGDVQLPDAADVAAQVVDAARGSDLVGIYAGGTLWRSYADDRGQINRFAGGGCLLDYSLVLAADKAVKRSFGGPRWSPTELAASVEAGRQALAALARPPRRIPPGRYRAWLEPAATADLLELFAQDGFSARAHRLGSGVGNRLVAGARLHPGVTLTEATARSGGPRFTPDGFVRPAEVPLVVDGGWVGALVSPRSAVEYGLSPNGASAGESPRALRMEPGALAPAAALAALGTGVWVSNLWYLNLSDRNAGRMTGMTRFATFWVEGGEIVAPLDVMRFDASWYDLFGEGLEAIGADAVHQPSASTYGARSTDSVTAPGLLLRELPFTL